MHIKQSGLLVTAPTGKPRYPLGKEGTQEVQLWWSPVNMANKLNFVAAVLLLYIFKEVGTENILKSCLWIVFHMVADIKPGLAYKSHSTDGGEEG